MERWICDINGEWLKVEFTGLSGIDKYGREYKFKDADTIYQGFWDEGECAFAVFNEYTPHLTPPATQ